LTTEQAAKESLLSQIANGSQMVKLEKDPDAAFALVIDGKALAFALEDDMKHMFLNLAIECASVIQSSVLLLYVAVCHRSRKHW
jgi:phospholipid-translocating ATPase